MSSRPEWKPHEGPQERVLMSNAYEILFGGQRGGGKTDAGMVWLIEPKYIESPKYRALILRKDSVDLGDWIDRASYMYSGIGGVVVGNPPVFKFNSGARFRIGHLKDRNSYEKYLGHEYQKILIEELTQIPQEKYYDQILGSCRSTVDGLKPQILGTTNPGGRGHAWVKRRFIDPNEPNVEYVAEDTQRTRIFIPSRLEDNPTLLNKDPGYLLYLEGLKTKDEALYKAWRLGDWDAFEGQFFNTWNKEIHVIEPKYKLKDAPLTYDYRLSWDEGSTNPRSVHIETQDYDGIVEVIWEYYKEGETADQAAMNIKSKLQIAGIYDLIRKRGKLIYDPSMNIRSNQTGIPTIQIIKNILGMQVEPANNDRIEGWRRIKSYLDHDYNKTPLLYVWENCKNLIRTITEMIFDDNNPEDLDTDLEDHAVDDLRYGLMSFTKLPTRFKRDKYIKKTKTKARPVNLITGY